MNVLDAISAHRTLIEDDERLFNDDFQPIVSPEVLVASENAVDAAFDALVVAPCTSLDEVRAKVDYILNGTIGVRDEVLDGLLPDGTDDRLKDFMRSLIVQKAPVPDPMLDLVTAYFTACNELETSPRPEGSEDDFLAAFCLERIDPLDEAIKAGTVVATREGAAAALRLAERQCNEGNADLAIPLMAAVRGFLEGRSA